MCTSPHHMLFISMQKALLQFHSVWLMVEVAENKTVAENNPVSMGQFGVGSLMLSGCFPQALMKNNSIMNSAM